MKYHLPCVAIVLSCWVSLMAASGSCSAQQPEQTSGQTYEQPGVIDRLPAFHSNLSARLTHRHSWLNGDIQDFEQWRNSARRKVMDCLLEPPPVVAFDPVVIASEDRGTYVAHKVVLNLTGDSRVLSLMLVPKASGPHPAVLLLHDHGAKFDIGKEKVIRSWNIAPEKLQSSEKWVHQYYGGRFVGDALAAQGFVCFATDMLNWSDRGGGGFENQQALAANLLQYGVSWSGLIAHEDLRAAEFLASRAEVDPRRITAMGLSVGGYRTWQVAALSPHISQGVSVCWMATQRGLLVPGNNQTTGQSAFTMLHPGLARELDYPDVASIACPKRMMFLCGSQDALFPKASTEAAFAKMRKVWQSQHADDALVTTLYDAPHEFNEQMQDDAFQWLLKMPK
jgi:dienelactone hydrolase